MHRGGGGGGGGGGGRWEEEEEEEGLFKAMNRTEDTLFVTWSDVFSTGLYLARCMGVHLRITDLSYGKVLMVKFSGSESRAHAHSLPPLPSTCSRPVW